MIRQTVAIFVDAYRELNARKMFWVTLILSVLAMGIFSVAAVRGNHLRVLWFDLPEAPNATAIAMYKWLFSTFVVGIWLTWIAIILALVSTASIFPEFISGGSIDLFLAKPIGRLRLFLTKFLSGMLFVTLQVLVFCIASFFVMGIRGGVWSGAIFLAVPIVVCLFSYLFGFCVLMGVWTRSTLAALLLTMLFWVLLWAVAGGETTVLKFYLMEKYQADALERQVQALERRPPTTGPTWRIGPWRSEDPAKVRAERDSAREAARKLRILHSVIYWTKTIVPKTKATSDLLDRWLLTDKDVIAINGGGRKADSTGDEDLDSMIHSSQVAEVELQQITRKRPVWWVIGTSLAFEGVVLALAGWVFCRRDY